MPLIETKLAHMCVNGELLLPKVLQNLHATLNTGSSSVKKRRDNQVRAITARANFYDSKRTAVLKLGQNICLAGQACEIFRDSGLLIEAPEGIENRRKAVYFETHNGQRKRITENIAGDMLARRTEYLGIPDLSHFYYALATKIEKDAATEHALSEYADCESADTAGFTLRLMLSGGWPGKKCLAALRVMGYDIIRAVKHIRADEIALKREPKPARTVRKARGTLRPLAA